MKLLGRCHSYFAVMEFKKNYQKNKTREAGDAALHDEGVKLGKPIHLVDELNFPAGASGRTSANVWITPGTDKTGWLGEGGVARSAAAINHPSRHDDYH